MLTEIETENLENLHYVREIEELRNDENRKIKTHSTKYISNLVEIINSLCKDDQIHIFLILREHSIEYTKKKNPSRIEFNLHTINPSKTLEKIIEFVSSITSGKILLNE